MHPLLRTKSITHLVVRALAFTMVIAAPAASAAMFSGDLFFTKYTGGTGVYKTGYSYDDATHSLSLTTGTLLLALPGSDGIIFAPDGDLLVGGQSGVVHKLNPDGTGLVSVSTGAGSAFHLALDPGGKKVYTSPFGGPLSVVPLDPFAAGTAHAISGSERGVTGIAFTRDNANVFYVNGGPNGGGAVGLIDLTTFGTSRLFITRSAHGMVYDSFTNLMTLFGAGAVGTFNDVGSSLKEAVLGACDYDQGAVDGKGHALIAGCDAVTFIDYSLSGDITSPDYFEVVTRADFRFIDDVAPLSGLGAPPTVPEPGMLALLGTALLGLLAAGRRRPLVA